MMLQMKPFAHFVNGLTSQHVLLEVTYSKTILRSSESIPPSLLVFSAASDDCITCTGRFLKLSASINELAWVSVLRQYSPKLSVFEVLKTVSLKTQSMLFHSRFCSASKFAGLSVARGRDYPPCEKEAHIL